MIDLIPYVSSKEKKKGAKLVSKVNIQRTVGVSAILTDSP